MADAVQQKLRERHPLGDIWPQDTGHGQIFQDVGVQENRRLDISAAETANPGRTEELQRRCELFHRQVRRSLARRVFIDSFRTAQTVGAFRFSRAAFVVFMDVKLQPGHATATTVAVQKLDRLTD
ncbi:hypothetical protein D3C78_1397220 [compost metagenome]